MKLRVITIAAALGAGAMSWPAGRSARGDDAEPVVITYQAPPDCPTDAEFFDQLRTHVPRMREARPGEPARVFKVAVSAGQAHVRARITIIDRTGHEATRTVESASCADIATATILVIALAIDPTGTPRASSSPSSEAPTAAAGPVDAGRKSAPNAVARPAPRSSPAASKISEQEPNPRPADGGGFHLGTGAGAVAVTGVAPGALGGTESFVSLTRSSDSVVSLSVRLALVLTAPGDAQAASGRAQFSWRAGRLDACLLRMKIGALPLAALPCLTIEGGALSLSSAGVLRARHETLPWTAGGVLVRLELGRLNVDDATPLFELAGGLAAPFRRYDFYFSPDTFIYEVPRIGFRGSVGIGVHFL